MPEYAQIDLFVYKAKIFRNQFVTIGWFNQINYMRGRRQDRILFLIGSSPAGGLFLFLPAELSNIKKQFESLTCIKGEDTHIADFPFSGKAVSVPLPFAPLSGSEGSGPYCLQVYPSVLRVRRKEKTISGASGEIALYFHVSTDYLLLGRELDRDSIRASFLELSAQMTELAGKL